MTDVLTVDKVSAWYGTARAITDVSLHVGSGESVALLGRNGAGKTSTFRAIMGAIQHSGERYLDGAALGRKALDKVARLGIAWVPEERRIFADLTVAENLELAWRSARRRGPAVHELLEVFPTLQPLAGRKGGALSGGQQQLVAVARAMACGPRLLLLDEPSEGLAPVIVHLMSEQLERLRADFGVSMLIAEQNLAFVERLTNRSYILERGQIVYEGTTNDLLQTEAVQMKYLTVKTVKASRWTVTERPARSSDTARPIALPPSSSPGPKS